MLGYLPPVTGPLWALNKMQVEYMVVGGTAVAFYGYARVSTASDGSPLGKHDLDFWYKPTLENYYRLLDAFDYLAIDTKAHRECVAVPKESYFRYDFEEFKTDFLPKIKGNSSFPSAYQRRETVSLFEVLIPFLSFDDLVESKLVDSRAKDIEDIRQLKIIRRHPKP
jgi:hypothetical protein